MLKFLREKRKWLLAIFGTLLLLVFLVPTTLTEIGRRSAALGTTWGKVDGTTVTEADRTSMLGQMEILSGLPDYQQVVSAVGLDRKPEHWMLLVREADSAGLMGGPEDGRNWIRDQIRANPNLTEGMILGELASKGRQSPTLVLEALGNLRGVRRLLMTAAQAPISDARTKHAAVQSMMGCSADVVVIDSKTPLPGHEAAVPGDDAMAAQFKANAELKPGSGEHGFGYRVPDRLKLEWMKVGADAVRASLENDPRLSGIELRKAFLKEPGKFVAPGPDGAMPDFDASEGVVRQKMLEELTAARLAEVERFVGDELQLSLRGVPKQGGYYTFSPQQVASQPTLAQIAERVAAKFGIPVPEVTVAADAWRSPRDVDTTPGLGTAVTTRFGTRPLRLGDLLMVLKEFGGSPTILVQTGVIGPALSGPGAPGTARDAYFFRVTEAQANHAPAGVTDVADAVRTDLLRLARYQELLNRAPQIEKTAIEKGMAAVAEEYGAAVGFAPLLGMNGRTQIPGLGADQAAVEAIIKRAATLPKTSPIADVPDAKRTFVVPVEDKLALLVVRITNISPLTQDDYEQYNKMGFLGAMLGTKEKPLDLRSVYALQTLSKRHRFEPARAETPANPPQDQGASN